MNPKVRKLPELRNDLYNTLDDLELLMEFNEPVDHTQLIESDEVFSRFSKKYGFADANSAGDESNLD